MGKDLDFINKERDYWGKIYTDITYSISETSPFLEESTLMKRKYYSKISILKDYIKKLDDSEFKDSKKPKFLSLFKNDDSTSTLIDYKTSNRDAFKQFENCSKCTCLNCVRECEFKSCMGCKPSSFIKKCTDNKINIRKHDNFTLDLTNNDSGIASTYKVLATLEDCSLDKLYIILENIVDTDDKFILYYYPGISEDNFGEIENESEFNFVLESFEQSDY
ncbi:DUF1292 domain-containing protein [Clostridium gasigenes]|uniref:DUF1292 domain-containing protein n=1 Tax=Clostridium gasigenes TaxID=94869 RepID=UPI00143867EE|nr:DUF1292 domain-containing protein [Clostridium gasigenes]NKF06344.1 DUF1292 domain-containing protein [Clostridium gasigenes]QSW20227.1 DUF1292 domain-containing protein [Clostridium gasigenes]